jgi:glycosyltransferase involved in cell wall biosynthesis
MNGPLNIFVPHCSDLLTDYLPHGDGLIAYGFVTNLARRGHRLHVAVQRAQLREPLHPNITLHTIPLTARGPVSWRIEYMLRVRKLLNNLKKDYRFDLIHQFNPVFTGMSLSLAGSGLPLVLGTYVARWPNDPDSLVARGNWVGRGLALARSLISRIQQRQADALLLTTPAACNRLPRPSEVRERIEVLPHGIDAESFSPEPGWDSPERLRADQQHPSILFFANVLERKGIFTLIDAFPAVARAVPNVILRIAGDGPALQKVKDRVARLSCAARIVFVGAQERWQAPALYRGCSIYCLPSYGEPYATTVLEAMSCARPVVVTDAGGLAHMVHDAGGKKVPVRDPDSLANALCDLLQNPSHRLAMGRYNRELVLATMTWEHVTRRLEEIYWVTLQRTAAARPNGNGRRDVGLLDRTSDAHAQERL